MSNRNQESPPTPARESLFKQFRHASSYERIQPYKSGRTELEALTLYVWNIALAESFYPSLQNLEVALRNRIDKAITISTSDSWWFKDNTLIVNQSERDSVELAERRLNKVIASVTEAGIVSELSFGFWTALLASEYDRPIWRQAEVLKNAFPYAPSHVRNRRAIAERFRSIKDFRNSVFHHDQIWDLDLKREHDNIIEALTWLDPSLGKVTKILDRFEKVHQERYKDCIRRKLIRACPVESKVFLASQRESVTIAFTETSAENDSTGEKV